MGIPHEVKYSQVWEGHAREIQEVGVFFKNDSEDKKSHSVSSIDKRFYNLFVIPQYKKAPRAKGMCIWRV